MTTVDMEEPTTDETNERMSVDASTSPPAVKRSRLRQIVNAFVSALVLAVCLFGYTFLGERQRPKRSSPPKSPVTIVATEPMRLHQGPVPITSHGVVVPLREIRLSTEVAGRIVEQSENLRAGRIVETGEVLIRLDPTPYELEVRRLQAQATQQKSEIAAADVGIQNTEQLSLLAERQVAIAEAEVSRVHSLTNQKAASTSEVDLARRAELTAISALVELENRKRELTAQRQLIVDNQALTKVLLERAELDLQRCVVRSPLQGIVVASSVEEQSFTATGAPFVTIEDSSAVEVRVNLTADQMVWVWSSRDTDTGEPRATGRVPQIPAIVTRSFGNDVLSWDAHLERIDGAGIDSATRTYPCLFRVDQPVASLPGAGVRRLTRGTFVDVTIQSDPNRILHQISESAIRPGNRVWLDVGGKLRIAQATVVSRHGNSLIVELPQDLVPSLSDVAVITSPISDPIEGMPVGTGKPPQSKLTRSDSPPEPTSNTFAKTSP